MADQRVFLDSDISILEHALTSWVRSLKKEIDAKPPEGLALKLVLESLERGERLLMRVQQWESELKK